MPSRRKDKALQQDIAEFFYQLEERKKALETALEKAEQFGAFAGKELDADAAQTFKDLLADAISETFADFEENYS